MLVMPVLQEKLHVLIAFLQRILGETMVYSSKKFAHDVCGRKERCVLPLWCL